MNSLISYHDGCSKISKARNHERSSGCCGTVIEVGPLSDARHTGVPLRPDIESLPQAKFLKFGVGHGQGLTLTLKSGLFNTADMGISERVS
jgi:hypothetical protein